ncbi:hypothetical protein B0A58_15215, partial [Flavobacterium branchiophilum NBRC 15030 = ATCC 35035]
ASWVKNKKDCNEKPDPLVGNALMFFILLLYINIIENSIIFCCKKIDFGNKWFLKWFQILMWHNFFSK